MEFLKIKQLIQEDDLGTALKQLQAVIKEPELSNELIITTSNYHALQSDIRKGIIEFEKATVEENRIRNTTLEIIAAAEEGTVLTAASRQPRRAYKKMSPAKRRLTIGGIAVLGFLYILGSIEEPVDEPIDNTAALGLVNMVNEMEASGLLVEEEDSQTAMKFEPREFSQEKPLNDNPRIGKAIFSYHFLEPVGFPDQEILNRVKRLMYEDLFEIEYVSDDFKEYAEALKGAHFRVSDYLYENTTSSDVKHEEIKRYETSVFYNDGKVLTIKMKMLEQFSGEDPVVYNRYFNYNLEEGTRITYNDIFQPLSERGISRKLTARLIELSGAASPAELQSLGFWNAEIYPPKSLYFTNVGINFVFEPYELTPEGKQENVVDFQFEELDVFLKKPFPFPDLLKRS